MEAKMDKPILHVHVSISDQIVIAVMRSYSRLFRRDLLTSPMWDQEPDWDTGLGLVLAQ